MNKPSVDVIHVSATKGLAGWKLDGFKNDELAAPDQLQDQFNWIIYELANMSTRLAYGQIWIQVSKYLLGKR